MSAAASAPWLALFVGGRGTRMGGKAKGLLTADASGTRILERQLQLASELGFYPVLVGDAEAYRPAFPNLTVIQDAPSGVGPLGGLSGVLDARAAGCVIALACDMPYLSSSLLKRLSLEAEGAAVVASRDASGRWDPLCARYDATLVLPELQAALSEGVRSFQQLFTRLTISEFHLNEQERAQLIDWDTPEDVARGRRG